MHFDSRVVQATLLFLTACHAAGPSSTLVSPTVDATRRGREVIFAAVDAVGGADQLRAVHDIAEDATIKRTSWTQGLRPSQPSVTLGWRSTVFDVAGQRIRELRLLDITGNQLLNIE